MTGRKNSAGPLTPMVPSALLLVFFALIALASAQNQKMTSGSAPRSSSQAKPAASAQHSAPAQHQGGSPKSSQQSAKPSSSANHASANRGTSGSSPNKGTSTTPNRGTPNNANKGTSTTPNRGTPNNANKGTSTAPNRGTPNNANKGTSTAPNRGTPNNANKGTSITPNRGATANANKSRYQPAGTKTVALKQGGSAVYRQNGQVRTIQTHGMTINRGVHGSTRIVSTRHGTTVVGYGRGVGYSQRSYYSHGGHAYVQRTYYRGGHYYAYGYRTYHWGGRPYYGYAPPYYWGPSYYRWAYNPWPAPVYYRWGWGGAPWYGYYGPYFAPYPVYPTATFWLTDYLIAANLQAAYVAQQAAQGGETSPKLFTSQSANQVASLWTTDPLIAANFETAYILGAQTPAATGSAPQLSPEVKQAIADQMKQEIAAEETAAASGKKDTPSTDQIPAAVDPKIRLFVVSTDLDLTTSEGVECTVTPGDVVYRTGDKPDADNMVDATVKSSKKDECAIGATVGVDSNDLQEMHNQLRIQMDAGLKELAAKQGKDGLPAAPDTKTQAGEVPPPKPDPSVEADLQQQQKDAAAAEAELPK